MSEGFSPTKRLVANSLRSIWNYSDFAVCKIIAVISKMRMQVFSNIAACEQKQ